MRGLPSIPSQADLSKAYDELQKQSDSISVDDVALWSQFARFDPRLAEQVITHLAQRWQKIHPLELNLALRRQVWPAAFGVLLEHIPLLIQQEASKLSRLRSWKTLVMADISPAGDEQYLIGLRALGGKAMADDAAYSLSLYRKWGFFGRDVLINKWQSGRHTLVPIQTRRVALDALICQSRRFTTRDYRAVLQNEISVRQAELDLKAHPRIRPLGATRGRVYVRR